MTLADKVQRIINKQGQDIVYRRNTSPSRVPGTDNIPSSFTETNIKGSVRQYKASEMAANLQLASREIRVAAKDLGFLPNQKDQIVTEGITYQVVSVNQRSPRGIPAVVIISVRGV